MHMGEGEIIRSYKQSKDKKKQIEILADLNAIKPREMKQYLREVGVLQ